MKDALAVVLAGYQFDKLEAFAKGIGVASVREGQPLGTGGGFLNVVQGTQSAAEEFLVCNGDSLMLADIAPLIESLKDNSVGAALLAVRVADASRFGTLNMGEDGRLLGFAEKHPGAGLVNGGVYLFRRAAVARFPAKRPLSFEYDVFPALVLQNVKIKEEKFFKGKTQKTVLDIGSNDGTQLKHFQALGWEVLGVESSKTTAKIANDAGVPTLNAYDHSCKSSMSDECRQEVPC